MTAGRVLRVAFIRALLAGAICSLLLVPASARAADSHLREDLRRLIGSARDKVFPALVNIHVVVARFGGGQEQKGRSVGSGTIISRDGYVLTNEHVVTHGRKFTCTLADKTELPAELIGEDPLTDLAILKINLKERPAGAPPLPVAVFGNSDQLQIGDYVMAMGSPFALSRSVTLGIVSNPERVLANGLSGDDREMELESGQRTGLFTRWIQHDALINPGNSGGPLVNLGGEVVGVNELGGSSIGFAIPAKLAQQVAQALIAHGKVQRSSWGLGFQPLEKTGLKEGALINSVVRGSPAATADIHPGDVLLRIAGTPVTARFSEEIPLVLKTLAELPVGKPVTLSIARDGKPRDVAVTPEPLEKSDGDERMLRAWGLTVEEVTPPVAAELHLPKPQGVIVSGTRDGWPAVQAEPPLVPGDVILSIDGKPTSDMAAILALYKVTTDQKPPPATLLFEFDRRGENRLTVLKPKRDKEEDPPREVSKGWIGVATQPITDELAKRLEPAGVRGFRVTRVYPGTQAEKAGLKVADIITALNGDALTPQGIQDAGMFARVVRRLGIGDSATLTLRREGKELSLPVVVDRTRLTPGEALRDRNTDFDLTVRELTFFDRDDQRWDATVRGVLVAGVDGVGWAGLGGLRPGDLIQSIDGIEVKDLATYRTAMEQVTKDQHPRFVVVVLRGIRVRHQLIEPDWKPSLEASVEK